MFKRGFDIVVSLLALFFLSPVIVVLAFWVRWQLGAPVFFRQVRPGRGGVPFQMVKFRTMMNAVDKYGSPLPDDKRLTPFGSFLRSSSLDELPEFWNVLKGDMSLVGPRPLLMEYLPLYSKEQCRRHEVRPGITGWAQVNGRNAISWEDKFKLDVWYVDNRSFWLDLKILALTVKKVVVRDGISAEGEATMARFTGNKRLMRLAILGASGHGKVVAEAARLSGWKEIILFDDAWPEILQSGIWEVAGDSTSLVAQQERFDGVVVAIGNNRVRRSCQEFLMAAGFNPVTVFHPSAVISSSAVVGAGSVVLANAVLNASARVGIGTIINTGAVVEHDCIVDSYSHISPNSVLAGGCCVGTEAWIGAGTSIKQLVTVGERVTVGMGSVVLRDVPAGQTVVGVPACPIKPQD